MNWKSWLMGLVWAVLTGMGSAVTMIVVDPLHFNFHAQWRSLVGAMSAFGLIAFFAYIKDSRPPSWKDNLPPTNVVLWACLLGSAVGLSACASARQVVVVADLSFATAVRAVDDAEWAVYTACKPDPVCEARHVKLNGPIKQALLDVKAVTLAIKATPSGLPPSLPALLKDLQNIRTAISALDAVFPGLSAATSNAETEVLRVLSQFVGGA